ncbi:hypothetical protein [Desulfosporosinus sp.]|uniref:hypothetical protein n=1 Tax=Desulfosporosinus sp. TaxID=157907 RepID=UPI000E983DA7|nr:hypothetical protein [Desulfosporosinus sp.]MBC2726147.1 hypothetical protein [Desulfosporosinus sp.]HBV88574.1 hypothetical protein [Desulfosporosinus sp.]
MNRKDRFYYGLIAGLIAGIVQNMVNLLFFYLNITKLRYVDWVAIMTYGHEPVTILDGFFALVVQLGLNGVLGVVFAYLLPILGFEHYLLKGMVFGVGFYQFNSFITNLYHMPGLTQTETYTAISNTVTSAIFGILLAILTKKLVYE